MPVGVVEGDGRVCDGDENLAAADDGGGGLAGELLRDSAGPWLRGKHVLPRDGEVGFCWVETVRRLRMVKASTWASFLHTRYVRYVLLTKNCAQLEVGVLQ